MDDTEETPPFDDTPPAPEPEAGDDPDALHVVVLNRPTPFGRQILIPGEYEMTGAALARIDPVAIASSAPKG